MTTWKDLTEDEREQFNKVAAQLTRIGASKKVEILLIGLRNGCFTFKDGKVLVSGDFQFKMLSEWGIPRWLHESVIKRFFAKLSQVEGKSNIKTLNE